MNVIIVGGGISGLTLGLNLQHRGVPCRIYEAAPEIKPLGVGITMQPHGTEELAALGLIPALRKVAVPLREWCFFNRFGQLIHREETDDRPQFLIHRAALHQVLLEAFRARQGADAVILNHRCTGVEQDADGVAVHFRPTVGGGAAVRHHADAVLGCDGIHSAVRRCFYPHEGDPVWSGINTWRGVTVGPPFLTGRSHVRVGELTTGKMVIYPIRDNANHAGDQLINWVAEVRRGEETPLDWNVPARMEDVLPRFRSWRFDWLDVTRLITSAEIIYEFPMSDRDPADQWTFGRVALVGDAAHPMLPRGGNGAMQAIIDARVIAQELAATEDVQHALRSYEAKRLAAVNRIVLASQIGRAHV